MSLEQEKSATPSAGFGGDLLRARERRPAVTPLPTPVTLGQAIKALRSPDRPSSDPEVRKKAAVAAGKQK